MVWFELTRLVCFVESGACTHLEWITHRPAVSSLDLIAASFQGGVAVFHVALPLVLAEGKDTKRMSVGVSPARKQYKPLPVPTSTTPLSKTPLLDPIAATKWSPLSKHTCASWVDLGPHVNPGLAIMIQQEKTRVALATVNIPLYGWSDAAKTGMMPFHILCNKEWESSSLSLPTSLINNGVCRSVLFQTESGINSLIPSLSGYKKDAYFASMLHPISSIPPGLTSSGEIYLADADKDSDGVLHIFTIHQCDRSPSDDESMLLWTKPERRHWLCRTLVGDGKNSLPQKAGLDEEQATGGSVTNAVCELSDQGLVGFTPVRIVRCIGNGICAVLYRKTLGEVGDTEEDASVIALVDASKKEPGVSSIQTIEGRDIVFLPQGEINSTRALILSKDGSAISILTRSDTKWEAGPACRSILAVEANQDYVECRRLLLVTSGPKFGLVVIGTRVEDGKSCVVGGELTDSIKNLAGLLPNMESDLVFWLENGEDVLAVTATPRTEDGRGVVAIGTTRRTLLLSPDMKLLSDTREIVTCPALACLGSHAVCFLTTHNKLRYICSLGGNLACGLIATLRLPRFGYCFNLLVAIRPDRLIYLGEHCGTRLAEQGLNQDTFLLTGASTKPALLLEPMVASAVGEDKDETSPVLRVVIEKFGRKVASITHGEEEGIGNQGAGITPRVYEILSTYGLSHASSWLLTGTVNFDRAAHSKILPSWMPVASKAKAGISIDAYLQLVANGDQYFSEYVKSPDHNMSATLPRPSDPSSFICSQFARAALEKGDLSGALKMLDLVGTETSDSMLLHLALATQMDPSADVKMILENLSGFGDTGISRSHVQTSSTASLAALVLDIQNRKNSSKSGDQNSKMSEDLSKRWMRQLAPSLQRCGRLGRVRQRLVGEEALKNALGGKDETVSRSRIWSVSCNESRHVW